MARFCSTLGTMISSGVPILDALEITAKTAGNVHHRSGHHEYSNRNFGRPDHSGAADGNRRLSRHGGPNDRRGEATGALDAMLAKISEFYDEEVDVAVEGLTQMMEPLMIVFLGGVCGAWS